MAVTTVEALADIARALRARKVVLAVETPEPHRLLRGVRAIAGNPFFPEKLPEGRPEARPFRLVVWSPHAGFQEEEIVGRKRPPLWATDEATQSDPVMALEVAWRVARTLALSPTPDPEIDAVLWVFRLPDRGLEDPRAVGYLEDLREYGRYCRHSLLLVSPVLEIPASLSRTVYRLDFPLPQEEELRQHVTAFFTEVGRPVPADRAATLARILQGLTLDEADEALADAYLAVRGDPAALPGRLLRAKADLLRRVPALEFVSPAGLEEIGGLENLKAFARELRATFTDRARRLGARPPRGILLVGVPGTGKSLAAKALAGDLPVIRLDMGAVYGSLLGQSEATLRQALRTLEAAAPVVAWVDELEKAVGSGGELDGGTSQRVLGTLLTWMQERAQERGVVVVATANDVSRLRPELLERFSYRFFVDLPGPRARAEILQIHLRKRGHTVPPETLAALARAAKGHSGRSLELCVERALGALAAAPTDPTPEALVAALATAIRRTPPLQAQAAEAVRAMQAVRDRFEPAQDPALDPEEETPAPTGRRVIL